MTWHRIGDKPLSEAMLIWFTDEYMQHKGGDELKHTTQRVILWYFVTFQKLKHTESDRLSVQVNAYLDNMIDVATLLEDSDTKTAALEKVNELEESLSHVSLWVRCGLPAWTVSPLCCVIFMLDVDEGWKA